MIMRSQRILIQSSLRRSKCPLVSSVASPSPHQPSRAPPCYLKAHALSTITVESSSNSRMKEHRITTTVPFKPEQLFDIVADVDKYKQFLPYCEDSVVLRRPMRNMMMAQLLVGFRSFLSERYTSRIRLERPRAISIAAVDSKIFNRLESMWIFKPGPTPNSADVVFTIRFEVANPIAAMAINSFFLDICQKQMKAFQDRCQVLYGEKKK